MNDALKVFGLGLFAAALAVATGPSECWGASHDDHSAEVESDHDMHATSEGHGHGAEGAGGHGAGGHGASGHGGSANPLSVDPDLAIFTALVFVLLLAVLGKFAWGPICEALDGRERGIADQIAAAQQANDDAQKLLDEHQTKLAAAADEVRGIMDESRKDAESQKQRIVDEAQQAAAAEKDRAVREINAAKNGALQELAEKSIDTAVGLAGQIVGKQLDRKDHEGLVKQALDKFPSQT